MTMHKLPDTVFRPKNARNSQNYRDDILTSANLGLVSLYLHNVCKGRSHILRYVLEASDLTICVI